MPPQVITVKNASKVAAALANEKCQRILDYLGKHEDATESKLSKELGIALSTVHYNMKVLLDAKLVLGDEYTYSAKGKEVTHYKLNKNPIVIVQEERQLDVLKPLLPAALIAAGLGIAYHFMTRVQETAAPMVMKTMAEESTYAAADAQLMIEAAPVVAQPSMLPWFIAGVVTTLVLSLIALFIYRRWVQNSN